MLNKIINKIAEYENANNYYFEMDKYENEILTLNEKVWYLDGKYKIEDYYYKDTGVEYLHTIKWIDINEETETTYNVNKNIYKNDKLNKHAIEFKNGYLYTKFPNFIKKEKSIFEKIIETIILKIKIINNIIEISDSNIKLQISREGFVPKKYEIKNTENSITNYTYSIIINSITEKDIKKEDL